MIWSVELCLCQSVCALQINDRVAAATAAAGEAADLVHAVYITDTS